MLYLKKLTFAPFFLASVAATFYAMKVINTPNFILAMDIKTLLDIAILIGFISLSALFFVLFCTISASWAYILPVSLLAGFTPLPFLPEPLNFAAAIGVFLSFIFSYFLLKSTLKTYLDFKPAALLSPPVKNIASFLILTATVVFYLSANLDIQKNGFQVPDTLIDTSLNLVQPAQKTDTESQPQLTKEQIDLLKKNPDLLKQYGLDPKLLDTLEAELQNTKQEKGTLSTQNSLKTVLKAQLNDILKPYINWIPILLALIFYFTLITFLQAVSIIFGPIIWLTFYILEKTGFVVFATETRVVKKMVV